MRKAAPGPKIICMVSAGRNPASGRIRRAEHDARAVECALRSPGVEVVCVYAGSGEGSEHLRDYVSMGVSRICELSTPRDTDVLAPLVDFMMREDPDIILAGMRAETGRGSGLLPYALAEMLGLTLIPNVVSIAHDEERSTFTQAFGKGRRRRLQVALPVVATVSGRGPQARQIAYAKGRRGEISLSQVNAARDAWCDRAELGAAPVRPARLHNAKIEGSAKDRIDAVLKAKVVAGKLMVDPDPDDAARTIISFLQGRKLFPR